MISEELNFNSEELTVNSELEETVDSNVEAPVHNVDEVQDVKEVEEKPAKKEVKRAPMATSDILKDFDWDSIGKKHELYDPNEKLRLEQEYDRTLSSITEHEVIDGSIVAMNNREVVINIGFKSDGVLPLNEFRYNPDLKVGDAHKIAHQLENLIHLQIERSEIHVHIEPEHLDSEKLTINN